jgi:dsDNA-binding SOS-regulon protein
MQIFDWLKQITYEKQPWDSFTEEDRTSFNPYMVHRFLSMNPEYIEFVNLIQSIPYTEKEKIYKLYLYMIPKKDMFLKYIKSNRTKTKEELLQHLASHYECSLREAYEYYHMHHSDTIKNILKKRGVDDKEIKKLLK